MNHLRAGSIGTGPVARARDLGPAIEAAADTIERTQTIPEPLLTQIHDARLARMLLPRSVDGDEVEPWVYMHAIEELARHDGSVGWNLFVANSSALIAPFIPLEAARAIFTDPRAVVSWGPPNQHKAHAVPGGYRISGEWHFASGSRQATWMGAHAQVMEPDGSLRLNRFGRPTTRTLLFRKEHATPIENWNPIGMRGTASEGYRLTDLFVPETYSGTREDPSLRRDPGPLFAFTMQGLYAVGVAGVAFGIARAMLDAFIALAAEKAPRGLVRLADSPVVQSDVARREAALGSARAYLADILREIWDEADDIAPIGLDARVRVRLGCAQAITTAIEAADYVYKAAGTSAIFPGTPFERRFRDIHTLSQQIQSRDSHFEAVGRVLFNGDPQGLFL
ncbi:MAG TPA: acyl-CoA dehydrogenase family protein [Rhodopila sp.]|uniref:acyl-CoA dehydrogenase family protein n=1 Tax=Rhodopila sp. TaxID=2480087 RepID=UPI002B589559|nr:acyl-CoA dehydrogenase family protein [Rhodopila sp.]HVY16948.1 acyl-CoA dehydrogenase family protein [Rhodopila sp.]